MNYGFLACIGAGLCLIGIDILFMLMGDISLGISIFRVLFISAWHIGAIMVVIGIVVAFVDNSQTPPRSDG